MHSSSKWSSTKKSEIINKYLNRTVTRKEFSDLHNIPVTTIDGWVKKHRKNLKGPVHQPKPFVPLIAGKKSGITAKNICIDFPGGIRMSCNGEFAYSDITSLAAELRRITE